MAERSRSLAFAKPKLRRLRLVSSWRATCIQLDPGGLRSPDRKLRGLHDTRCRLQVRSPPAPAGRAAGHGVGPLPPTGTEHIWTTAVQTFDCAKTPQGKVVAPGDTVTMQAGTRGPIVMRNCVGTAAKPILVRNDPAANGPVIIERTGGTGGFVWQYRDNHYTIVDGTQKWVGAPAGTCGLSDVRNCGIVFQNGGDNTHHSGFFRIWLTSTTRTPQRQLHFPIELLV
jgi:hypothetical protein